MRLFLLLFSFLCFAYKFALFILFFFAFFTALVALDLASLSLTHLSPDPRQSVHRLRSHIFIFLNTSHANLFSPSLFFISPSLSLFFPHFTFSFSWPFAVSTAYPHHSSSTLSFLPTGRSLELSKHHLPLSFLYNTQPQQHRGRHTPIPTPSTKAANNIR